MAPTARKTAPATKAKSAAAHPSFQAMIQVSPKSCVIRLSYPSSSTLFRHFIAASNVLPDEIRWRIVDIAIWSS
jgi:hypothetical protein